MTFRSSLAAKILLVIVLVSIVGFGTSTIFTIHHESVLAIDQRKTATRRLATALVASIESAMLQERPDVTRTLIQELKGRAGVEGLTVYRRNGVEAFTDLATLAEVERNAGVSPEVIDNIRKMRREPGQTMSGPLFRRAVETLETQESLEIQDGVTLFVLDQPIPNRETCQGCHGTDHTVRAVVQIGRAHV